MRLAGSVVGLWPCVRNPRARSRARCSIGRSCIPGQVRLDGSFHRLADTQEGNASIQVVSNGSWRGRLPARAPWQEAYATIRRFSNSEPFSRLATRAGHYAQQLMAASSQAALDCLTRELRQVLCLPPLANSVIITLAAAHPKVALRLPRSCVDPAGLGLEESQALVPVDARGRTASELLVCSSASQQPGRLVAVHYTVLLQHMPVERLLALAQRVQVRSSACIRVRACAVCTRVRSSSPLLHQLQSRCRRASGAGVGAHAKLTPLPPACSPAMQRHMSLKTPSMISRPQPQGKPSSDALATLQQVRQPALKNVCLTP